MIEVKPSLVELAQTVESLHSKPIDKLQITDRRNDRVYLDCCATLISAIDSLKTPRISFNGIEAEREYAAANSVE